MSELPGSWDNADRGELPGDDGAVDRTLGSAVSPDNVAGRVASSAADIIGFQRTHNRIDDGADEKPTHDLIMTVRPADSGPRAIQFGEAEAGGIFLPYALLFEAIVGGVRALADAPKPSIPYQEEPHKLMG